jgi:NAD(P)-dependent dehydrogenase (short-subunit alcohol dehydrogenase family)|tara:strand:+ start:475 stop:1260 length:786 start_codon:yes stop_codon:yes gene_type:complete
MNHQKLINKNIIISAGADGIGLSIAQFCLNEGATVYVSDINKDKLSNLEKHQLYNKKLFINNLDAKNYIQVEDYFNELGKNIEFINGLINNVGIAGPTGRLEELSHEDWVNTINVNINSHFYFSKFSIPYLKKNGGSIINLSSTAGLFGFPLRTPYASSKWATIGLTKSLAMELGEFNIRVNAICPGSVEGDRINKVINAKAKNLGVSSLDLKKDFESMISLKSFVTKEDIADMAVFLLSDQAKKISGQVMTVDGNTERMN